MISLHQTEAIEAFAARGQHLWRDWLKMTAAQRRTAFEKAVEDICGGCALAKPRFNFTVMGAGTNGSFGKTNWQLSVNQARPQTNGITCKDFVMFCRTLFHETRHCEQYFRIAQGLALGRLEFPITRDSLRGPLRIQRALRIPAEVAMRAVNTQDNYKEFAALPKLAYCTNGSGPHWDNWDPTVDDWMELTYHPVRSDFSAKGQNANGGVMDQAFYWNSAEEVDAFAAGDALRDALIARIRNYQANANKPRTDAAFGP